MSGMDTLLNHKIMISTSKNKLAQLIVIGLFACLTLPGFVSAQSAVTLSVSPTLFEMTASPSQTWTSTVRVINSNSFPIQIYTDVVNFAAAGESGQGTMIPVLETETNGGTLAEWINVTESELLIPAEQTVAIEFTIDVPSDAPPGGHYAALLIGTRSFGDTEGAAQVETSQVVTSLLFLSVAGDIDESGMIRDFTANQIITEQPEAAFSLRFENTGNVHLQPQGDITITNMWGKERGLVPINKNSQFGNVLPNSIRQYNFAWSGDWSFADIGRYTAIATVAYGDQQRQFVSSQTSFWVIPWRALLLVTVIFSGLIWCVVWGIKLYIRRMLQLAGVSPGLKREIKHTTVRSSVSFTAPIEEGILDLRSELRSGNGSLTNRLLSFATAYKVFMLVGSAVLIFVALFVWYVLLALTSDRGYQVSYERNGELIPITQNDTAPTTDAPQPVVVNTLPDISLVDRSGSTQLVQQVADRLIARGYEVQIDTIAASVIEDRTVIVFDPSISDQIEQLRTELPGALVSAFAAEDESEPLVTIYLGTDQSQ